MWGDFIARVTSHIPDKGQVAAIDIAARPAVVFHHDQEGYSAPRA
jgi:hypothetical protein